MVFNSRATLARGFASSRPLMPSSCESFIFGLLLMPSKSIITLTRFRVDRGWPINIMAHPSGNILYLTDSLKLPGKSSFMSWSSNPALLAQSEAGNRHRIVRGFKTPSEIQAVSTYQRPQPLQASPSNDRQITESPHSSSEPLLTQHSSFKMHLSFR